MVRVRPQKLSSLRRFDFAEYGANKCRINWPQNRLLYILRKLLRNLGGFGGGMHNLITQIALVTAMLGLGRLLSLRE
jgi:hypothetical protein